MVRIILYIILSLSVFTSFGQINYSVNVESGIGVNPALTIGSESVIKPNAFISGIHGTVSRSNDKKLLLESSIFALFIRNKGEISNSKFIIRKSKLGLDFVSGYNFLPKTQLLAGFSASTIPELSQINLYLTDNLKFDFLFKVNQIISPRFYLNLRTRVLMHDLGDHILLEDPKYSISLGLTYKIKK